MLKAHTTFTYDLCFTHTPSLLVSVLRFDDSFFQISANLLLLSLAVTRNFSHHFIFNVSSQSISKNPGVKEEGLHAALVHWDPSSHFRSFWLHIFFYLFLEASSSSTHSTIFKNFFIHIQCVCGFWVGCGNWFTSQPLFSFLAISRLSGLSAQGFSFTEGEYGCLWKRSAFPIGGVQLHKWHRADKKRQGVWRSQSA